MREGVLLAEESPQELMERCGCDDLETVFLQLSKKQETSSYNSQVNGILLKFFQFTNGI